jgi:hypothetical protein
MSRLTPDQDRALENLVRAGTLSADQAVAVRGALQTTSTMAGRPGAVLTEVAGYVGGGLMLGGAFLLLSLNWQQLGRDGAAWVLLGYAAALVIAAVAVAGGRVTSVGRGAASPVRRRLVGVLFALASAPAALAAGTFAQGQETVVGGAVGLGVAAAAYALVPSIPALLAMSVTSGITALGVVNEIQPTPRYGLLIAFLALGALWAAAAVATLVRPRWFGLGVAAVFGFIGAQVQLDGTHPLAYTLTAAIALACFVAYWLDGSTVLLALGVIGMTIAVPEAVTDLTANSLGAPFILLIAGGVLIAVSAVGLWLRSLRTAS